MRIAVSSGACLLSVNSAAIRIFRKSRRSRQQRWYCGAYGPVQDVTLEEFESTLRVNLVGPFTTAKYAVPYLRESDQGRVINIGSTGDKQPYPEEPCTLLEGGTRWTFSDALTRVGRRRRHTVNTITPRPVESERADNVIEERATDLGEDESVVRTELEGELPLGEMVAPEEVADLSVFLASKRVRHLTSQDVTASSGLVWW